MHTPYTHQCMHTASQTCRRACAHDGGASGLHTVNSVWHNLESYQLLSFNQINKPSKIKLQSMQIAIGTPLYTVRLHHGCQYLLMCRHSCADLQGHTHVDLHTHSRTYPHAAIHAHMHACNASAKQTIHTVRLADMRTPLMHTGRESSLHACMHTTGQPYTRIHACGQKSHHGCN